MPRQSKTAATNAIKLAQVKGNPMVSQTAKELYILGVTSEGKAFRPSDWAERLAGVMSQFQPGGARAGSHWSYSPWCVPMAVGSTKCVKIHPDLRDFNVMAWDFCINFAKDNDLQLSENPPV
jgi:hypothetical protein